MSRINLLVIASLGLVAACSGPTYSTKGQLIECQTDPGSGVILRCNPAEQVETGDGGGPADPGNGGDHGDDGECIDIDEDGDGEPGDGNDGGQDPGQIAHTLGDTDEDSDDDDDGIPDVDDCDENEGEDGDDDCDADDGVDLPYDIKMQLGQTYTPIADAFAEKGAQPAAIVDIEMDGGTWRYTDLVNGTAFAITQADCDHAGNRDTGRDRIVITWRNPDGSQESDHLDLRYCE